MSTIRFRTKLALVALSTLLVMGIAVYLIHAQANAGAQLQRDFARRATLAAKLTEATLAAGVSDPTDLTQEFSGPKAQLPGVLQAIAPSSGPATVVLSAQGRVLAGWPLTNPAAWDGLAREPDVQRALRTGFAVSDVAFYGLDQAPVLRFSAMFDTPFGRRILVDEADAGVISIASGFLRSAPAVAGARAYLLDGHGRVLASSTNAPQAVALPDRALAAAVAKRPSGNVGRSFFVTAPIKAGTNWQIAFVAPRAALFAPLASSTRLGWLLFGAFLLAILALLAVGGSAFRKSAQLAGAHEREHSAQRLAHERLHDALTGLPNRALFLDRTEHALERMGRRGWAIAVMFIDLDHFKRINDSLGHAAGDELLAQFGTRLRNAIRPSDTVSRFGGDEFLILVEDLIDHQDALRVASRIRATLAEPFTVRGRELHITCCIGVAIHDLHRGMTDAAALVRDADAAMYSAKDAGRGGVKVFDEELHLGALRRLDMEVALRAAIAGRELMVHYQPIVELPGGATRGVEALARWTRVGVGPVPPPEFIGLAEECGLIDEVGDYVLSTAMSDVREWFETGLLEDGFLLSVNVSPKQLANRDFPAMVRDRVDAWPLPASSLCLEITESAVVTDGDTTHSVLLELSGIGVQLAIDDFGIGQSSLEQLVNSLPVDILKLDRAFVADMDRTRERAVVAAVAPMAGDLGMAAIAEGVETSEQAAKLTALGYQLAQGYFFGRPVPAEQCRRDLVAAHASQPA
jgi:diguanylate cyclase (GGDEF)-like protein